MVDDTDNEIQYIKTNPFNLKWTLTSRVKQEEENSKPLHVDRLDGSEHTICGHGFDHVYVREKEEAAGQEELPGMLEDLSKPGILCITNNSPWR